MGWGESILLWIACGLVGGIAADLFIWRKRRNK